MGAHSLFTPPCFYTYCMHFSTGSPGHAVRRDSVLKYGSLASNLRTCDCLGASCLVCAPPLRTAVASSVCGLTLRLPVTSSPDGLRTASAATGPRNDAIAELLTLASF